MVLPGRWPSNREVDFPELILCLLRCDGVKVLVLYYVSLTVNKVLQPEPPYLRHCRVESILCVAVGRLSYLRHLSFGGIYYFTKIQGP
jgi:hypothetical protein